MPPPPPLLLLLLLLMMPLVWLTAFSLPCPCFTMMPLPSGVDATARWILKMSSASIHGLIFRFGRTQTSTCKFLVSVEASHMMGERGKIRPSADAETRCDG